MVWTPICIGLGLSARYYFATSALPGADRSERHVHHAFRRGLVVGAASHKWMSSLVLAIMNNSPLRKPMESQLPRLSLARLLYSHSIVDYESMRTLRPCKSVPNRPRIRPHLAQHVYHGLPLLMTGARISPPRGSISTPLLSAPAA